MKEKCILYFLMNFFFRLTNEYSLSLIGSKSSAEHHWRETALYEVVNHPMGCNSLSAICKSNLLPNCYFQPLHNS